MRSDNSLEIVPLTRDRLDAYLRFFDHDAFSDNSPYTGCYCYYPFFAGDQQQWEARSATENRIAACDCIEQNRASGYLAYEGGRIVGWCNAGPATSYPAIRKPSPDLGIIMCFVIAPQCRGRGIAGKLLKAACDGLGARGLTHIRARPSEGAQTASANFPGPLSMYLNAGFQVIARKSDGSVIVEKQLA